ncbi:unnamed protein product [Parascedosporium putredinis]|uniref:Rgp1-domain-containing protein n=1 Tax=Parascedosporium putredinis TaxID=1442378 RepID=A0A9P1MBZ1_9PEZI|nr:unnamed protein product [Parascedosporium putredinis]CAI7999637.1 unnamed protein product [Parascedosporium putredinis]
MSRPPRDPGGGNVRVFVKWHDQTVFAGEDVKCTITFQNVASTQAQQQQKDPSPAPHPRTPRLASGGHGDRLLPPSGPRGHRSTASSPRLPQHVGPGWANPPIQAEVSSRNGKSGHRKSLSIVSLGGTGFSGDDGSSGSMGGPGRRGMMGRHGRSASLHIATTAGSVRAEPEIHSARSPEISAPRRLARHTPKLETCGLRGPPPGMPDFKFPAAPHSPDLGSDIHEPQIQGGVSPLSSSAEFSDLPVRSKNPPIPTIAEHHAGPASRILASTSLASNGTPRSSGEFYSMSNNSTETLVSEYPSQPPQTRTSTARPLHLRRLSNISTSATLAPESIMMGYARIQGSFTLDGSLVNLNPFEQVKKKAVVDGQGGGVVGLEPTKRDSGLLGSFGWGSISSSLGELLGGSEMSTIKTMRGIANSKSIPLLSTPQSLLFGRAMKISYTLVIGTQRVGGPKEQRLRSVEIPFRVLGSVNGYGEILGHDLMNPYIILQDHAKVPAPPAAGNATVDDFLGYVDELLSRRRNGAHGGLLSPTATMPNSRRPSVYEEEVASTAKEAIDMAILRSNRASEGQSSPNRFEIARNGQRVALIVLTRAAYRLGEVVTMVVDFANAEVPCYAVHSDLETYEKVDQSLAMRSEAGVQRVTRKVLVSGSEATLFSKRAVFMATIPISATPEFITSGVSLEWKVRVEFVVPADGRQHPSASSPRPRAQGEGGEEKVEEEEDEEYHQQQQDESQPLAREGEKARGPSQVHPLLEPLSRDDKGGLVLVAVENMPCESFEVAVPLRVYGSVGRGLERLDRDDVGRRDWLCRKGGTMRLLRPVVKVYAADTRIQLQPRLSFVFSLFEHAYTQ